MTGPRHRSHGLLATLSRLWRGGIYAVQGVSEDGLDGEKIAALCREFGISRVTGHKIIIGTGKVEWKPSRTEVPAPIGKANRLPFQVETRILQIKQERPK